MVHVIICGYIYIYPKYVYYVPVNLAPFQRRIYLGGGQYITAYLITTYLTFLIDTPPLPPPSSTSLLPSTLPLPCPPHPSSPLLPPPLNPPSSPQPSPCPSLLILPTPPSFPQPLLLPSTPFSSSPPPQPGQVRRDSIFLLS